MADSRVLPMSTQAFKRSLVMRLRVQPSKERYLSATATANMNLDSTPAKLGAPSTSLENLDTLLGAETYLLQYLPVNSTYETVYGKEIVSGHLGHRIALGMLLSASKVQIPIYAYLSSTFNQHHLPKIHCYGRNMLGLMTHVSFVTAVLDGDLRDEFKPVKEFGVAAMESLLQCFFIIKGAPIRVGSARPALPIRFFADVRKAGYRYREGALGKGLGYEETDVAGSIATVDSGRHDPAPPRKPSATSVSETNQQGPVRKPPTPKNLKRKVPSLGPSSPAVSRRTSLAIADRFALPASPTTPVTPQARKVFASDVLATPATALAPLTPPIPDALKLLLKIKKDLEDTKSDLVDINESIVSLPSQRDKELYQFKNEIHGELQRKHNNEEEALKAEHEQRRRELEKKLNEELIALQRKRKDEFDVVRKSYEAKKAKYAQKERTLEKERGNKLHLRQHLQMELEEAEKNVPKEPLLAAWYSTRPELTPQAQHKRLKLDKSEATEKEWK
ncbi:hypothetical protein EK21DRAFT_117777 [Setomelanomma holmii]|uniref:Uncharacterized protein n=1 Tax=Setomelanomma holmii TaxID=210430 RepID=A0A9P4GZC0_9PLEO|nr:hypothetical protein EK21DRAFT_117777 [Setomelanomma holmii]